MYDDIVNAERWLTFSDGVDSISAYMTNILLNAVDVQIEVDTLYSALTQGDYA
jgi:hypothetical protein